VGPVGLASSAWFDSAAVQLALLPPTYAGT
jgi:hypothetical protein